jgi:hypothetical protein
LNLLKFITDSKKGLWKRSLSVYGGSERGTWRVGSFTGDPEGYVEEGFGNRNLSP